LSRRVDELRRIVVARQELPRRQIPWSYLDRHLALIKSWVPLVPAKLIFTLDETGLWNHLSCGISRSLPLDSLSWSIRILRTRLVRVRILFISDPIRWIKMNFRILPSIRTITMIIWTIQRSGITFIKCARGPDENNNRKQNSRNEYDHRDW
jgi:hypothetical protein